MDKQTQAYFEKLNPIFIPRIVATRSQDLDEVVEVFMLAYKSIISFYVSMSQDANSKEILLDMFGGASDMQLDDAHQLLIFWFLWQRDHVRHLNFLKSVKVRDGLKNIWSFSELEINNLEQEFNSKKEPGMGMYYLWKKLQVILGNNNWSPAFVFPALSAALKKHWMQLDWSVGDNI